MSSDGGKAVTFRFRWRVRGHHLSVAQGTYHKLEPCRDWLSKSRLENGRMRCPPPPAVSDPWNPDSDNCFEKALIPIARGLQCHWETVAEIVSTIRRESSRPGEWFLRGPDGGMEKRNPYWTLAEKIDCAPTTKRGRSWLQTSEWTTVREALW